MQLRWESHSHTFSFVPAGTPLHLCSSVLLHVRTVFLASLPGVAVVAKGSDVFQRPRFFPCKVKPVLQDKINCPAGQFFFSIAKCSFFIDFILISIEKNYIDKCYRIVNFSIEICSTSYCRSNFFVLQDNNSSLQDNNSVLQDNKKLLQDTLQDSSNLNNISLVHVKYS